MVSVPSEFMPKLEAELNKRGFYSYPQLMAHILTKYFNGKGAKPKPATKITVREVQE